MWSIEELKVVFKGSGKLLLSKSADIQDGILCFEQWFDNIENTDEGKDLNIVKFVPASGAATRLFKGYEQLDSELLLELFKQKNHFPEFQSLKTLDEVFNKIQDLKAQPKGSLKIHQDSLFEEQLLELKHLEKALNTSQSQIHFTIPAHFNLPGNLKASSSVQNPKTNVPCWDLTSNDFYIQNKEVLLRPGGHGTLIENLNQINAEAVWIKNIDNLAHPDYWEENIKVIKNMFLLGQKVKKTVDHVLKEMHNKAVISDESISFLKTYFPNLPNDLEQLFAFLNRPFRIAGMVANTGAPGGGPFWVKDGEKESIQIVEQAQIDQEDEEQKEILAQSKFFNPVQILVFPKNFKQEKFDLQNYVNKEAFFLSEKVINGDKVKIVEYPGLWNGGMHNYLSLFIELPLITFAPVKSIKDNLNPLHQPK